MAKGKTPARRKLDSNRAPTAPADPTTTHICAGCCGDQVPRFNDATWRTCSVCSQTYPKSDVLTLRRCKHLFCRSCLTRYFQMVIDDEKWKHSGEKIIEARCCKIPIPLQDAERYLPDKVAKQYKEKSAEYAAVDRTYCHVQACAALVPKYMHYDKQAVCPKCMASTCTRCKLEWHDGPCIVVEDPQLMQLARIMNWRQCPHCHSLVERTTGCRHMTQAFAEVTRGIFRLMHHRCRCGQEFCYGCGVNYADCECVPGPANVAEDEDEDDFVCYNGFD